MYVLPQEIEVWYIIPAIRRELARELSVTHGVSYDKIGKLLGLTKAAISQYLGNKRAAKIKLHPVAKKEVVKSCEKIMRSKSDSVSEILRILRLIEKKKLHCEVCGKIIDGELHDCKQVILKYKNLED